jgi:hypothetical protein
MRGLMSATLMSLTWLLAGCTATVTEYVKVPVASCPAPPIFVMPARAVDMLPDNPDTEDALRAIAYDGVVCKETLQQCVDILDSYR